MNRLYTIGYEGAAIEDFVETLKLMEVDVLLDVRELAMSRRKGFAKSALRAALTSRDIDYRHEKRLGSPKPMRDDLKRSWDYERFFQRYGEHLEGHGTLLGHLMVELPGDVTLMCYERNHKECHRNAVAAALAKRGDLTPIHLGVQGYEQRKAYEKTRMGTGQGLSAAQ